MAGSSIGYLEVAGYGAAMYAMDKACKAADIRIIGIDTINPKDTSAEIPLTVQVKFEGTVSAVKIAAETASTAARRFNEEKEIITWVIERPYDGTKTLSKISKIKLK